jgi:hypothetical protein
MADDEFIDYYTLLKVAPTASQQEIERAYMHEVSYWHPDRFTTRPQTYQREAHRRTVALNQAYELLRNPDTRELYDELFREWQLAKSAEFDLAPGERILQFPAGPSFGRIYLKDSTDRYLARDDSRGFDWTYACEATGSVILPESKQVALWVGYDELDLRPLMRLEPDDLYALDLSLTPREDRQLAPICRLTGLADLDLSSTVVSELGIANLASQLTSLEHLNLMDSHVGSAVIRTITHLPLVSLHFRGDINGDDLRSLGQISTLRDLTLAGCLLNDGAIQTIPASLPMLESLDLSDNDDISGEQLRWSGSTSLRWLSLNGCPISDAGVSHLASMECLNRLDLSATGITDAGLEHLGQLSELTWLDLSRTSVTDRGMHALAKLSALEWLGLGDTEVTPAGLRLLVELANLRVVDLRGLRAWSSGNQPYSVGLEDHAQCQVWL